VVLINETSNFNINLKKKFPKITRTLKMNSQDLKKYFIPGFLSPGARTFYFVLFLLVTVLQTYTALLLEEQLAYLQD